MNQEALCILKALADPTRFQIVEYLSGEDLTTAELMERLQMSQPTVFRHLQKLQQAGIVKICSRVNPQRFTLYYPGLNLTLQQLLAGDPDGRDLEQIRKEEERKRYLERRKTIDGRWIFRYDERWSSYVLKEILDAIEPGRVYKAQELRWYLADICYYEDMVCKYLTDHGFLKAGTRTVQGRFRPYTEKTLQRTEQAIHLEL